MKTILVFGAGGMVADHIEAACKKRKDVKAYFLKKGQVDITKFSEVDATCRKYKPDIIINCAGYVRSDEAELNIETTYTINLLGAILVAKACRQHGSRLVHMDTCLSKDPVNEYAMSKRLARYAVEQILRDKVYVPILGWLFSKRKSNNFTDLVLAAIKEKRILEVTNNVYGSPTYAPDAADYIIERALVGASGEEEVANKGKVTRWQYCEEIFKILNKKNFFKINNNFKEVAKRPKDVSLEGTLRPYEEALREFLATELVKRKV